MKHYFRDFTLILLTIVLASCASKQTYSPEAVGDAEQLYLEKQYSEAASAFNQQAAGATGTEHNLLLLRSVISHVKAGQLTRALQLFNSIQINEDDVIQKDLARLTRALSQSVMLKKYSFN
jgi:outer membrane PBP1 activator LpoA protein